MKKGWTAQVKNLKLKWQADGRVCSICGKPLLFNGDKFNPAYCEADHIKPKSKYPELEFDILNLQPVCRECNGKKWNNENYIPEKKEQEFENYFLFEE